MGICAAGLPGVLLFRATDVQAQAQTCTLCGVTTAKQTICHADGLAETTKFSESLSLARQQTYTSTSTQGTPRAGHELDTCGPCGKK